MSMLQIHEPLIRAPQNKMEEGSEGTVLTGTAGVEGCQEIQVQRTLSYEVPKQADDEEIKR